jgi:hypothetical protein
MVAPESTCVVLVSHFLDDAVRFQFRRLVAEVPADHDVFMLLNLPDGERPSVEGIDPDRLVRLSEADLLALPYPEKCRQPEWRIDGNLDLAFLAFRRRVAGYRNVWFIEYDVHYEGNWSRFFEHFRRSPADLIGTTMTWISQVMHKLAVLEYPEIRAPAPDGWATEAMIKGFFPICRISEPAFAAIDAAYRAGVGGHYEITLPTIVRQAGLTVEDVGGSGPFTRAENRHRFYFAYPASFSHSPGTFVFRPPFQRVLPRPDSLWHPVKPAGAPAWFPVAPTGTLRARIVMRVKPVLWHLVIRAWFAIVWNRLPADPPLRKGRP